MLYKQCVVILLSLWPAIFCFFFSRVQTIFQSPVAEATLGLLSAINSKRLLSITVSLLIFIFFNTLFLCARMKRQSPRAKTTTQLSWIYPQLCTLEGTYAISEIIARRFGTLCRIKYCRCKISKLLKLTPVKGKLDLKPHDIYTHSFSFLQRLHSSLLY